MMRRTHADAAQTRMMLLEAAAKLFAEQGVSATTLNEISTRAGVTRGAFYWHFQDKEDIIRAIWQTYAAPRLAPLIMVQETDDPVAGFRRVVGDIMNVLVRDTEIALAIRILLHNVEIIDRNVSLRHFFLQVRMKFLQAFEEMFMAMQVKGALRPDVSPRFAAQGFMAFLAGLLGEHMLDAVDVDLDTMGVAFTDIYLRGVLLPAA